MKRLGGTEPLVLSVSRPALDPATQKDVVVLNVFATWSGCGGVDLYSVSRLADASAVELMSVLVTW